MLHLGNTTAWQTNASRCPKIGKDDKMTDGGHNKQSSQGPIQSHLGTRAGESFLISCPLFEEITCMCTCAGQPLECQDKKNLEATWVPESYRVWWVALKSPVHLKCPGAAWSFS